MNVSLLNFEHHKLKRSKSDSSKIEKRCPSIFGALMYVCYVIFKTRFVRMLRLMADLKESQDMFRAALIIVVAKLLDMQIQSGLVTG